MEWLRDIIIGDEKWVVYVSHTRKRQWLQSGETGIPMPMNNLHPKKVILNVCRNMASVVYWELLLMGSTVTAEYYCEQLERVAKEHRGKQDKVYFLCDNARPHIANTTRQKLLDRIGTVLPDPPYSPDLAQTDYHLFHSQAASLDKNKFDEEDHLK